jgi:Na+-transporting methylmalonyl-CoA/oxaloacetate decarboxylase gamma subunit
MLEQSGILTAPGMGSVLLFIVFICYLIVSKIIKAIKNNNDEAALQSETTPSSPAAGVYNASGVAAAITAAVNEYRKYNS